MIGSRRRALFAGAAVTLLTCSAVRAELGVRISAVQALNSDAALDTGADYAANVAADGDGHWVAVWQSTRPDYEIGVARSIDGGEHWSSPVPLNTNAATDNGADMFPDICTDRKGNWVAVWMLRNTLGGSPGDSDIFVARSIDNGANRTSPVPLNTNAATYAGEDNRPVVATDRRGNWMAVWHSDDTLGNTTGADFDLLVSRSTDNGASWSVPIPLNTNAGSDAGSDFGAVLTTDGKGRWVVVWTSNDTLGNTIGSDYDVLVARSDDNGATWTPPAALNSTAGSDAAADEYPRIATDGIGNWVAVWQAGGILSSRSIDNGVNWSAPNPLPFGPADKHLEPSVASDGAGNWIVAWADERNLGGNNYAIDMQLARSIDHGAHWSSASKIAGDAGNDSDEEPFATIATDGLGQWVVAWQSQGKLGDDYDLFSARFGFPDCNGNLIGDPTETAVLLTPDLNFNHIPDLCELPFIGPVPPPGGCGGGLCGGGIAAVAPFMAWGVFFLGRASRRSPPL